MKPALFEAGFLNLCMTKHIFSYLAIGDSYTIGEAVPLYESFPYQAVQFLREAGVHFHAPEIIAKTGWTTFELAGHIMHSKLNEHYDFVTLLIGVNNQFRGLSTTDYKTDFEFLLRKAIHLAGEKPDHVIVLSIPDYGLTPFAKKMDARKISSAIDHFNEINLAVSKQYHVNYLNIAESTRKVGQDESLVAADGLHPSGKEYANWATLLSKKVVELLK